MLEVRTFGKTFEQKEREIINLQGQVKEIYDFLRAYHERKPKHVENSFFKPHTFPTYFTTPEKSSPFYHTYISSLPDYVKYIHASYRSKSKRTNATSTAKTKGKVVCLRASSSDSRDVPEIPPSKFQKEEENLDKDDKNDSYQDASADETLRSFSLESQYKENYIPRLFMANIKEEEYFYEEPPEETLVTKRTKLNSGPWFMLDDIPPCHWKKRLLEFRA
ncbi:unnamed protein product [Lathyrus sativus]|nr:unnamed protein product [Lathyrus sativus]